MTVAINDSRRQHRMAAEHLARAVEDLRAAKVAEGDLEWSGRIEELIDDATFVRQRLLYYAEN